MSRQFKLARISALRKTPAPLENVSANGVQKSAAPDAAGNSPGALIQKQNETTTKDRKMNPLRKKQMIVQATTAGSVDPFTHTPTFLLACIMALNADVQAIAKNANFTIPDPVPNPTLGDTVDAANAAKSAAQVAAEKAASDKAAADAAAKAQADAAIADAQKAAAVNAMPL
jgi:hypothetical protein